MTDSQRTDYKESCKRLSKLFYNIFGKGFPGPNGDNSILIFFNNNNSIYDNIKKAISQNSAYNNSNDLYQYENIYLTNIKNRAINYAKNSFAFGEIGYNVFFSIKCFSALKSTNITIDDIPRYKNNLKPLPLKIPGGAFMKVASPEELFEYVNRIKNWELSDEEKSDIEKIKDFGNDEPIPVLFEFKNIDSNLIVDEAGRDFSELINCLENNNVGCSLRYLGNIKFNLNDAIYINNKNKEARLHGI